VLESPVPVLVDVYADWCGPCKQIAPFVQSLEVKYPQVFDYLTYVLQVSYRFLLQVKFLKVNVDNSPDISGIKEQNNMPSSNYLLTAGLCNVRAMPTFIFYKGGKLYFIRF
jgi:thiol-disulfide isomerase/thioredoxin